jgi:hypothetical protein
MAGKNDLEISFIRTLSAIKSIHHIDQETNRD